MSGLSYIPLELLPMVVERAFVFNGRRRHRGERFYCEKSALIRKLYELRLISPWIETVPEPEKIQEPIQALILSPDPEPLSAAVATNHAAHRRIAVDRRREVRANRRLLEPLRDDLLTPFEFGTLDGVLGRHDPDEESK